MSDSKPRRSRWIAAVLSIATMIAAMIAASAAAGAAAAQEVRDLTSSDPTEEELIEILRPKEDGGDLGSARGLGVKPRVKCTLKNAGRTRGLGLKAKSDVVAIKVNFDFNSSVILPEETRILDKLGRALTSQALGSSCFQIKGHTDSVGSDAYNDWLSRDRAAAVARYLATHFGVETDRLDAVGFGERQPLADNSSDEGRGKNRRVEIVTVGFDA